MWRANLKRTIDDVLNESREDSSAWNKASKAERLTAMKKALLQITQHRDLLAKLEEEQANKLREEAVQEISILIDHWSFAIELLTNHDSTTQISFYSGYHGQIRKIPYEKILLITPYNFPLVVVAERLPYMLAAGCSVIIKPSPKAAGAIECLTEILNSIKEIGRSVVVTPNSSDQIGKTLIKHEEVKYVSFTGSSGTGRQIMKSCANYLKPVNLELGGNNHAIVAQSADLNAALDGIIQGFCYHAGQCCISTTRIHVHESLVEIFIAALVEKLNKIGEVGPLIDNEAYERHINIASKLNDRCTKIFPIEREHQHHEQNKFWPKVFIQKEDEFSDEEIFSSIAIIKPYERLSDVVIKINRSKYGLASVLWSQRDSEVEYFKDNVKCGRLWVNCSLINFPELPISGMKNSGIGYTAGRDSLTVYSRYQSVVEKK